MTDHAPPAPETFLPLKPVVFQILLALAEAESHGYGIIQAVHRRSDGRIRLQSGPFYRHLRKLIDGGLVEESDQRPEEDDNRRGAYYRLTALGREVAAAEGRRLTRLLDLTAELGLAPGEGTA